MQLFVFRELLGAIRAKSATFFTFSGLLLFLFLASSASLFMIAPGSVSRSAEGQPIEDAVRDIREQVESPSGE